MARINLWDLFPVYTRNCFIDVPDSDVETFTAAMTKEFADVYIGFQRKDHAYYERRRYHKAFYSLNTGDGIEGETIHTAPSSEELYMDKLTQEQLSAAFVALTETQRRRIKAHVIYGITVTDIALAEGAAKSSVSESITRGVRKMKNILQNF